MSAALLTAYAVGGGIPPATYEALRVHEDGVVRAVVGNAWPFGAPQDEAGSYEHRLEDGELAALAAVLSDPALGEASSRPEELTADAGRCQLRLGDDRDVVWSASAPAPEPLGPVVERLRAVLAAARRHPAGAVALALEAPATAGAGEALPLGITLRNPGREPVALAQPGDAGRLRARVRRVEGEVGGRPDLEALVAAEPVALPPGAIPAGLPGGSEQTIAGEVALAAPGRWRVDVLARLDADLPYEGETVRLECVMLAGPVLVTVGA